MRVPHSLVKLARTAAVAAVLGGGAIAAVPAEAASSFSFGFGSAPYHYGYPHMRPMPGAFCMTDWQVRNALARAGYSDVRLYAGNGRFIRARAVRGKWVYRIDYNRCGGYIADVSRLRHR